MWRNARRLSMLGGFAAVGTACTGRAHCLTLDLDDDTVKQLQASVKSAVVKNVECAWLSNSEALFAQPLRTPGVNVPMPASPCAGRPSLVASHTRSTLA